MPSTWVAIKPARRGASSGHELRDRRQQLRREDAHHAKYRIKQQIKIAVAEARRLDYETRAGSERRIAGDIEA